MSWWHLYGETNFAITLLFSELLISRHYGRRNYFPLRIIVGFGLTVLLCYYWPSLVTGYSSLWIDASKYLAVFIASFLTVFLCYKGDFWSASFACVTGYCMQHISSQLVFLLIFFMNIQLSRTAQVFVSLSMLGIVCLVMHIAYFSKMKPNTPVHVNNRLQAVVSAIILCIAVYISLFGMAMAMPTGNNVLCMIILLFSVLSSFLAIMLEFSFVQLKQNETDLAILKHMVHMAKYQYQESKESIQLINIKLHDLRHQMRNLSGQLDPTELKQIMKSLEIYDSELHTGNDALDVILMEKKLLCSEKDIRLTYMMDAAIVERMSYSDIYSLFGNAIENAMEAVSCLEEDKRCISISGTSRGGYGYITIENYFSGELRFENGLPQTRKTPDYHGFGVKSIKSVVEHYGGELEITTQGDIFRLEIFFMEYNKKDSSREVSPCKQAI